MPSDLPIHRASYKGSYGEVAEELENGQDPNTPGAQNRYPLHRAVAGKSDKIVSLLLKHGAECDIKDKAGKTPLHWAAMLDAVNCAHVLLLEGKCNVDCKAKNGRTPCHFAASENKMRMLEWLLENGAQPDALDNNGQTPYDLGRYPCPCFYQSSLSFVVAFHLVP